MKKCIGFSTSASHIIMPSATAVLSIRNTIQMCYPGGEILSAVVAELIIPLASHIMPSADAVLSICNTVQIYCPVGKCIRQLRTLQNIKQTLR